MQVKPSTAEWMAKKEGRPTGNLSDPTENILAGMSYLSYLKRKFGGITPALHAYSLGPTAYIQGERNPGYVKSILGEGI
jgi:soluble lytic murein transglycosylase-like protein